MDCGLTLNMIGSGAQGTGLLRDIAIFNLPPSRARYPIGLLTALPWFVYMNRCVNRIAGWGGAGWGGGQQGGGDGGDVA